MEPSKRTAFRRLEKLADYMDGLDRSNKPFDKFDMGTYGVRDRDMCNTATCAMGTAALSGLFKRQGLGFVWDTLRYGTHYTEGRLRPTWKGKSIDWSTAISLLFGSGFTNTLFVGNDQTPKRWAARARRYMGVMK